MGGAADNCRSEPRGPIYIPADSLHNHKRKGTGSAFAETQLEARISLFRAASASCMS